MKYAVMILFLSAGFSTAADDEASKKLLKDLEGSYKFVSGEQEGNVVETEDPDFWGVNFVKVLLKGDKITLLCKNLNSPTGMQKCEFPGRIAVDAAKKPAHVDIKIKFSEHPQQTASGIIAIDGESIKICFGNDLDDKTRPTDFKTTKDDKNKFVITLKRIKE